MTDNDKGPSDLNLGQNGTSAAFYIGGQRMIMTAAELDSTIDLLRRIRELVQPQVSNVFPRTRLYCDAPRIGIVVGRKNTIGLSLRHTGLGWVHFRFSQRDVSVRVLGALTKALLRADSRAKLPDAGNK